MRDARLCMDLELGMQCVRLSNNPMAECHYYAWSHVEMGRGKRNQNRVLKPLLQLLNIPAMPAEEGDIDVKVRGWMGLREEGRTWCKNPLGKELVIAEQTAISSYKSSPLLLGNPHNKQQQPSCKLASFPNHLLLYCELKAH